MIEDETDPARGRRGLHHRPHQRISPGTVDSPGLVERSNFRQIAVHVSRDEAGDRRLHLASHIARSLKAELVAITSTSPSPSPSVALADNGEPSDHAASVADPSTTLAKHPIENPVIGKSHEQELPEDAVLKSGSTHRQKEPQPLVQQWKTIGRGSAGDMLVYAKMVDLTILGQHADEPTLHPTSPGFRPEDIAVASGRPTLIVPKFFHSTTIGLNVLVAWDGSGEVVRALHDAMPLMRDAHRITVLQINGGSEPSAPVPGASAAVDILERHGFQAFAEQRPAFGETIVDSLLDTVEISNADLLVCGLFHRSQLRESVFGGVSHDLLRRASVAILASH